MTLPASVTERLRALEPDPRSKLGKAFRREGVRDSLEFRRVFGLPRRTLALPTDTLDLSRLLATDDGSMTLKPLQAAALEELHSVGGVVGSIRVGGGKTLPSFLAARVAEARRPLLLIPADLIGKTRRDFRTLAEHFHVPADRVPRIESYQMLGRPQAATLLDEIDPDLIIMDEAHYAKNPRAAVTRRIDRFKGENPSCRFVILSGTLTTSSLTECAHLYEWALGERSPLPRRYQEVIEWGLAVDEGIANPSARLEAGALAKLWDAEDRQLHAKDPVAATRQALRKRIHATPGVVASTDAGPACSLQITMHVVDGYNAKIEEAFAGLDSAWCLPNGEPFAAAVDKWRHECELALGFYYTWIEPPPKAWLDARRDWCAVVRHVLSHNRLSLDSPSQVEASVDAGAFDGKTANRNSIPIGNAEIPEVLARWRKVEPTYEARTRPEWLDDRIARYCRAWLEAGPGLIWVSHVAVGEMLSKALGLPFYRQHGLDAEGRSIDLAKRGSSGIASLHSCRTGRNLQRIWHRNLVAAAGMGAEWWEQFMGRTHREGQLEDRVFVDLLVGCGAQVEAFRRAQREAEYAYQISGQPQRLGYADTLLPSSFPSGPRWVSLG